MEVESWPATSDLESELVAPINSDSIKQYSFFQLVELLHKISGDNPEDQDWETEGKLTFSANASLGFPLSDVSSLEKHPSNRLKLETTFLGLSGVQSPLPSYILEQLLHEENSVKKDFLDFFNNRLIALFYRVWRKYRYYVRFQEDAEDSFSARLFSLVGLANKDIRGDTPINWCKMLAYSGMLAGRSRSPQTVAGIIAHCFDLENVSIRQWQFRYVDIPDNQLFQLGKKNCQLAEDSVIGSRIGDISSKFVVCISNLDQQRFQQLLPNGDEFEPLCKVIEVILREQMAYDFELSHNIDNVPSLRLGEQQGAELGWSTFLGKPQKNKQQVLIQIRP